MVSIHWGHPSAARTTRSLLPFALSVGMVLAACDAAPPPSPAGSASPVPVETVAPSVAPSGGTEPSPTPATSASPAPSATPTTAPPAVESWRYRTRNEITATLFAETGRVVVVERDWAGERPAISVLDEEGSVVEGWPWAPDPSFGADLARAALGPDDSVYVLARGASADNVVPWMLHRLSASAEELPGYPVRIEARFFCEIASNAAAVYVACEVAGGGSRVWAVGPDGADRFAGPVTTPGSASIVGFDPEGRLILAAQRRSSLTVLALEADGAERWSHRWGGATAVPGLVLVDDDGWIHTVAHEFEPDACAPPIRSVYDTLRPNGRRAAGWPVQVDGWASDPAVLSDGSIAVVTDRGRAMRWTRGGDLADGWPARNVDVSFACYDGSTPVAAGERLGVAGSTDVTVLGPDGSVPVDWPTNVPGEIAGECPGCTPGTGRTVSPVLGAERVYVATYDARRRPRVVTLEGDGSVDRVGPPLGRPGHELMWLASGPDARVWAVVTDFSDEASRSLLVMVAQDGQAGR